MLRSKLPPGRVKCDACQVATVELTSKDWDSLWREVHAQQWMLMGAGRRSWRLLCPRCRPCGDAGDLGPRGAAG